jgi:hypothetical protein
LEAAVMAEDENQSQFSFGDFDKESAGSIIDLEDVEMFDSKQISEESLEMFNSKQVSEESFKVIINSLLYYFNPLSFLPSDLLEYHR